MLIEVTNFSKGKKFVVFNYSCIGTKRVAAATMVRCSAVIFIPTGYMTYCHGKIHFVCLSLHHC